MYPDAKDLFEIRLRSPPVGTPVGGFWLMFHYVSETVQDRVKVKRKGSLLV